MTNKIDIGQEIKKEMKRQNFGVTKMSKELGTNKKRIYRIFAKNSIDTELLFKVSIVLKHDFFKLYSDEFADKRANRTM